MLATAVLVALAASAHAQVTDSTATASGTGSGTLVKLGTGFTRGLYARRWGVAAPVVLGVEHHLAPAISVYGNAFAGFRIGQRNRFEGYRLPLIGDYGFDLGVKYYYNQAKRRQQGRATGPFVGDYLALQSNSTFNAASIHHYSYSTLTLVWGMQRRIGKYGWLDAYVGGGVRREPGYFYGGAYGTFRRKAYFGFAPEIGLKFSLGSQLTH